MPLRIVKIKRDDGGRRRFRVLFQAGAFVVHRSWSRAAWCLPFTVTHAHSGLSCSRDYTIRAAKAVARALDAMPINWRSVRNARDLTAEQTKTANETIRAAKTAPKEAPK